MLKKQPASYRVQIAVLLAAGILILSTTFLPITIQQTLYSCSLTAKELILFLLPWLILSLIFKATITFARQGIKIIRLLLLLSCLSNFIALQFSLVVAHFVYSSGIKISLPNQLNILQPLWQLPIQPLIKNEIAVLCGAWFGFLLAFIAPKYGWLITTILNKVGKIILTILLCMIPIFMLGSIIKFHYEGVFSSMVLQCGIMFLILASVECCYLFIVYLTLNNLKYKDAIHNLHAMMPAVLSGFVTMSSAATLPLTLQGTKKIIKNQSLADLILPITTNIHLIGDSFAVPVFSYVILGSFNCPEPFFTTYLAFSFYAVIAKFSGAAIPGGGIMVVLPILEKYFHFHGDMLALITAIYLIFDPFTTIANILGNGALIKLVDKLTGNSNLMKNV